MKLPCAAGAGMAPAGIPGTVPGPFMAPPPGSGELPPERRPDRSGKSIVVVRMRSSGAEAASCELAAVPAGVSPST